MPDTIPPVDDGPLEPDVDFESWAEVSAKLLRRTVAERARVLSESGMGGAWPEIDSGWLEALAEDIEAGRLERVDRYAELCAAEIRGREHPSDPPDEPLNRTLDVLRPELLDQGGTLDQGGLDDAPSPSSTPPFGQRAAEDDSIEVDVDVADERTSELDLGVLGDGGADEALSWPIEKYAWLCAELELRPDRADHLWRSHGLDNKTREVVSGAWSERLANDARLKTQHQTLVRRFLKLLQT